MVFKGPAKSLLQFRRGMIPFSLSLLLYPLLILANPSAGTLANVPLPRLSEFEPSLMQVDSCARSLIRNPQASVSLLDSLSGKNVAQIFSNYQKAIAEIEKQIQEEFSHLGAVEN